MRYSVTGSISYAYKQRHFVLTINCHLSWKKGDGIAWLYEMASPDAEAIEIQ
ncbi:hypothetical protein ACFL6S_30075 [Candidatus Poribacteria bacterium]